MNITWLPPNPENRASLGPPATFYGQRGVAREMYLMGHQTRDEYRTMLAVTIAIERGLIVLDEANQCLRLAAARARVAA